MVWHPVPTRPGPSARTDTWGCPDRAQPYPAMHHSLMHPCTSPEGACCGLAHAAFNLRFQSFVAAPQGLLLMAYEVSPRSTCCPLECCVLCRSQSCAAIHRKARPGKAQLASGGTASGSRLTPSKRKLLLHP